MRASSLSTLLAVLALSCAAPAGQLREADSDVQSDILHSDLPLFNGGDDVWPRAFAEGDSFGCASRVAFGDWALRDRESAPTAWRRISNYGVFHCLAVVGKSADRARLEEAEARPAFFVFLGATAFDGRTTELWALQVGARPGSDYLLLARAPAEGPIDRFDVLQSRCPAGAVRDAGAHSFVLTRYCVMNTKADLRALAGRMARLPAAGTLALAGAEDAR
jgi:hypothetical protein